VDPERLAAVKAVSDTTLRGKDAAGGDTLEIVTPYREEWGRHNLSVAYRVTYRKPRARRRAARLPHGGPDPGLDRGLRAGGRWTGQPHHQAARGPDLGAKDLAEGHFDRRLSITSHDELEILAETFNHMTGRLKENVEQLEESNKKLAAVNEELKELDRMKSDLLANVSHELRTPLTAIKGYTDYILERRLGAITEKQEKGLVVVQRNLERLSKTINALLDFSRMDVGRIALNLQPFPLARCSTRSCTALRSELEKKGLKLRPTSSGDCRPSSRTARRSRRCWRT
jgi:signal transduction histidine kinase